MLRPAVEIERPQPLQDIDAAGIVEPGRPVAKVAAEDALDQAEGHGAPVSSYFAAPVCSGSSEQGSAFERKDEPGPRYARSQTTTMVSRLWVS